MTGIGVIVHAYVDKMLSPRHPSPPLPPLDASTMVLNWKIAVLARVWQKGVSRIEKGMGATWLRNRRKKWRQERRKGGRGGGKERRGGEGGAKGRGGRENGKGKGEEREERGRRGGRRG